MSRLALGLIETIGLAAAVEAADAAVKAANIALIGYELSRGGGLVTVKMEGDVGAVKAAVEAGCIAAERVNRVFSKQVIPRPATELNGLIYSKETVGLVPQNKVPKQTDIYREAEEKAETDNGEDPGEVVLETDNMEKDNGETENIEKDENETSQNHETEKSKEPESNKKECCNLCSDPLCPRKKGELRSICIHYDELKEVL